LSPFEASAAALAARVLGTTKATFFRFQQIASADGSDVFELESVGDQVVVRGNNAVTMATGLNWYLKHYAHCQISWYGEQLQFPQPLPRVETFVRQVTWAKRRYFLNYCCFCYSLAWWNWAQWEKLIDWMALNGVNMPLAVTGQEAVWQAVGKRLELSDEQINAFFSGPPFLPFVWMGCFDGWVGPLPRGWIDSHEALGKQILARERELGMTPVLQGFTGHVPKGVVERFPDAKFNTISYLAWGDTYLIDPLDPLFPRVAKLFLEEQERRFGTDHLYAVDTFIEMVPPSGDPKYLASLSKALHRGMMQVDPQAVWVLQGWQFAFHLTKNFWSQPRIKAFLDAVPDEHLLVLDLFCEFNPGWSQTDGFFGKPWLWCNIQNFGGNVTLTGALERNNSGLAAARRDPRGTKIAGVGMVNEGLCQNPPVYEFLFEQVWRNEPVNMSEWVNGYARRRYGRFNQHAEAAWQILLKTVYADFRFYEERVGGHKSLIALKPTLKPPKDAFYDNRELAEAWRRLLLAADDLRESDTYRFDLVHVARHVISNHAAVLRQQLAAAAHDAAAFRRTGDQLLQLILDLEKLVATRPEFLLGRWLHDARRWGMDQRDQVRCDWLARLVITHFGPTNATELHDYARKEWQGMLRGYYLPRWQMFIDECCAAIVSGQPIDEKEIDTRRIEWEEGWLQEANQYPITPIGDEVDVGNQLWKRYSQALNRTEAMP
jgi:alpha-N-acetylglucosaminidase